MVRRYQHAGFGHWFLCSCLDDGGSRPPALIPVLESFIRRHVEPPWPKHAESCDFYRDPAEQRAITRSYGPAADGPLRLLRHFVDDDKPFEPSQLEYRGYSNKREALATLLRRLQILAGLNFIRANVTRPKLGEQFKALRAAAAHVEMDRDLPLSQFLGTYLPALPEFMAKIAAAPASRFTKNRPHGIFVAIVSGVSHGHLLVGPDSTIPVRGRISVFGERDGDRRDTTVERAARSPYLAVCLVGRARHDENVQILRAYAHPCVSRYDLMLVDIGNQADVDDPAILPRSPVFPILYCGRTACTEMPPPL